MTKFLLMAVLALQLACGSKSQNSGLRIIDGERSSKSEFPEVVRINTTRQYFT